MKYQIKYIEHKTSAHTDRDEAWIARVWPSNSGKTLYFNGMALKRCSGYDCNHFDALTGEEYWVSGVKKRGSNRHWAGGGKVFIERCLLDWYSDHVQHADYNGLIAVDDLPVPNIQELSSHENQRNAEQDAQPDAFGAGQLCRSLTKHVTVLALERIRVGKATARTSRKKLAKAPSFNPKSIATFKDLPEAQPIELIGLIAPNGNPGGSSDGPNKWTFSTDVCAWKVKGGPVVREPALIVCRKISEQKLASLMKRVSNLDIVEFIAERPRTSDRPKYYPQQQRFELIRFGKTVQARDLQDIKKEHTKPVVVEDSVFGKLELSRRHSQFAGEASFRRTDMVVSFETTCPEELREIIAIARTLWKNRQAWFSAWRKKVYEYYIREMMHWWSGDGKLTEKRFYNLLGWPVGVEFFLRDGKFGYRLSGWCEDLFTDHGIDAIGTSIHDMEVTF